jgi:hypothetical protein
MMVIAFAAAGCAGKSVLSPESFAEALEQTDHESYDDVDDITGDLDNKRALAAGMYIQAEDSSIRNVMADEDINGIYELMGNDAIHDLYSRDMERATVLICRDKTGSSSLYMIGGVASCFDSAGSASDYYDDLVSKYEDKDNTVSSTQGDISYTIITKTGNRNAKCYAIYLDNDCVLVLAGYESKTNALGDSFDEICGYMDIPSPDLSGIDCTKIVKVDNRVKNVADQIGAKTVDITKLTSIGMYDTGTFYGSTDNLSEIKLGLEELMGPFVNDCRFFEMLNNISFDDVSIAKMNGAAGYMIIGYRMDDHDKALKSYNAMISNIRKQNLSVGDEDSGNDEGIEYYSVSVSEQYITIKYTAYCEDDHVYLIFTESFGSANADEIEAEVLSLMGF